MRATPWHQFTLLLTILWWPSWIGSTCYLPCKWNHIHVWNQQMILKSHGVSQCRLYNLNDPLKRPRLIVLQQKSCSHHQTTTSRLYLGEYYLFPTKTIPVVQKQVRTVHIKFFSSLHTTLAQSKHVERNWELSHVTRIVWWLLLITRTVEMFWEMKREYLWSSFRTLNT